MEDITKGEHTVDGAASITKRILRLPLQPFYFTRWLLVVGIVIPIIAGGGIAVYFQLESKPPPEGIRLSASINALLWLEHQIEATKREVLKAQEQALIATQHEEHLEAQLQHNLSDEDKQMIESELRDTRDVRHSAERRAAAAQSLYVDLTHRYESAKLSEELEAKSDESLLSGKAKEEEYKFPTQGSWTEPPAFVFAKAVSIFCLSISTLILSISLPIYLFSSDEMKCQKAGGLVKTTLGFIIASGAGLISTLSFGF